MNLSSDLVNRLLEIPDEAWSSDVLEKHPRLREREFILEIADHVNRVAREDIGRAERMANLVAWLSELIGDNFCRARAFRCLGNVQVMRSNYQQGLQYFERSLKLFEELGADGEEAATLSGLLQPLIYMGKYAEALEKAQRAREIANSRGDELLLARLNINFGNILHRQDRFSEAVSSYQSALPPLNKLGELRDCAIAFLNLAVCYISLNDFKAAEEAYRRARLLSEKENMPAITAQADYNIAYLYYYRGDYGRAIELYQHTRLYCQRSGDEFHSALCDLDQSEIYLDLHLHEEATGLATRAESAFRKINMPYEAAKAVVWLGIAAYQGRKTFQALELLCKAREQMQREGNTSWTALLDLYQALLLQQEGRYCEALRHCKRAQLALTDGGSKAVHANLIYSVLQLDLGHNDEAMFTLKKALTAAENLQSPTLLFHVHKLLGQCQEAQSLPVDAEASYNQSLKYLERIPLQTNSEGFKIPYSKKRLEIYEALLSLGRTREMSSESVLDLVEKCRSREISELISFRGNALKTPSRNRSVLVEQLKGLREELSWYYRQTENVELMDQSESAMKAAELHRLIRIRENSLLDTLEAVRGAEEEFHSIQAACAVPVDKVRRCLMDDEIMLEFLEVRGSVHVCLLTNSSCEIVPLTRSLLLRERLRQLHVHFVTTFCDSATPVDDRSQLKKTLSIFQALNEILIKPIEAQLGHMRLIISPEGPLRYLPFHALFDGSNFLTERYILSYTGSASLYHLGSLKTPIREKRDVIVSDKTAAGNYSPTTPNFVSEPGLEQVNATEGTRFIHLDCLLSPRLDSPMLSSLKVGDSEKTTLDVFNLNLTCAALGVTGIGPGVRAEGDGKELEGLARAFEYAGARTLVLPLWNNRCNSTRLFFDSFYAHAALNSDKAHVFQTTLRKVRAKYPNPFHWAPFIIRGQTGRHTFFKSHDLVSDIRKD